MIERLDCVVIGAGAIGLSIARALALAGREVTVLEAESAIGTGISSRNSEVIHAGIYYPPESLKARLCVEGRKLLYAYCAERGVPHKRLGKIVVATADRETALLETYRARANDNGVRDLVWLSQDALVKLEPAVRGVAGLLSPSTGIVDSHALMASLEADLARAGGRVVLHSPVLGGRVGRDGVTLSVGGREPVEILCAAVVNASGLAGQEVAGRIAGLAPASIPRRYLAKGCYFTLQGKAPFSHLIYPVAEEGGLGVHLTLDLAGAARFGPNVIWQDGLDYGIPDGLRDAFAAAISRYYPGLDGERLSPGYAGIRPKLVGPGGGFADFRIQGPREHGVPGLVNLYGIESPGLTASLAIALHVRTLLLD